MELVGPTSHWYVSQRLRLHYVDWGNRGAPTMLLIHGGRDHCRNWDWVAQHYRERYHVIAPDLRGHGDSQWVIGSSYQMADFTYDIAQLVHQQELSPVTIIGHSLGGGITLRFSGLFPETLKKVVAIEGLGPSPKMLAEREGRPMADRLLTWVEELRGLSGRSPRRYETLEAAIKRMQGENPHLSPEQARHLTIHGVNRNEDGSWSWKFDNYVRSFPPQGFEMDTHAQLWGRIDKPVLLIRGAESWASDPVEDGRIKHFQNARLINMEGAGHWAHHDKLNEFLGHVDAFLGE